MKSKHPQKAIIIIPACMVLAVTFGAYSANTASANLNQVVTSTSISTPTNLSAPVTASPTDSSTPITSTIIPPQPNEYVTQADLVNFFEKVTSQHLNTINLALAIVGIGLAIVGIFSINTIVKLQRVAAESQDRLDKFTGKENEWDNQLERMRALTNLYIIIIELRDPNPDLRRRALHRLRASSDIMAVSQVSYLLLSDPDTSIRAESALALNDLLPEGVEEGTLLHAVEALTKALADKGKAVVLYSIKTLGVLISRGESIPLSTLEKLRELANNKDKELAQTAKDALV